jgi:uncharacterized membrane protein YphA (DoxX/SURF4 family)
MQHGFAKLSKGPVAFAAILHVVGVPAPYLMAWLTILTEVFGGLAVLLGAFVPLLSLPMAALLLVAIFTVHLPYGFRELDGGGRGIRTPVTLSGKAVFKTACFNRSHIPPRECCQ